MSAQVPYLGNQIATYVLDFHPFDTNDPTRQVYRPTRCENRRAQDFDLSRVPFTEMWDALADPLLPRALGSPDYLAYPPLENGGISSLSLSATALSLSLSLSLCLSVSIYLSIY